MLFLWKLLQQVAEIILASEVNQEQEWIQPVALHEWKQLPIQEYIQFLGQIRCQT